ncbi:hypothetical protein BBJ29_006611 [Phytophthora kernoviae]|uniref:Uncharacterized protein n=1 Tax=Phytophthora kernoviae TaxID=325452 RepID=A0A3F2RZQ2_9STRA|nr:hypothetical protein BBJ29_006611 [Phytophthora kernoviae]RLN67408.1 hypothetical protein BBP00_00001628 [Phytophthora kernoviae]
MKLELVNDAVAVTALRGLMSMLPRNDSAAEREAAALSLVVNLQHLQPVAVRQALQSIVQMESYSQSLQRYPLVKQAFWEQVLASDLMKLTTELLEVLAEFFACLKTQGASIQPPFSGTDGRHDPVAAPIAASYTTRF